MVGLLGSLWDWAYRKRITIVRRSVLVAVFVLLNSMLFGVFSFGRHPLLRYVLLPNASCRYLENAPTYCYYYPLQQWLAGGFSTAYLELVIPMLIVVGLILVLGRGWCSWLCPFGLIQEIIMSFRGLLGLPYKQLRYKWVAFLDQFKYALLFFTLLVALSFGIPYFGLPGNMDVPLIGNISFVLTYCQICPAQGIFTILQIALYFNGSNTVYIDKVLNLTPLMITVLVIFFAGSFFIRMFWCRICPMGALMGLMSRFSLFWLKKEPERCTKCKICLRVCPMDFHEVYEEMERKNITGSECTLCGRCVESCPERQALSFNLLNFSVYKSKPRR